MLFNPVKEISRLRKEMNRLLSKGLSNIYLKILLRKNDIHKTMILKVHSQVWDNFCQLKALKK